MSTILIVRFALQKTALYLVTGVCPVDSNDMDGWNYWHVQPVTSVGKQL